MMKSSLFLNKNWNGMSSYHLSWLSWSLVARAFGSLLLQQRCAIVQPCFISW
jgi:hypothetical protein